MAQGKFSQPRQSRPEEDDLEAVLRRRRESQGADIPQQTEPQRDASLDETQFLSETMMIKNLPTQEDPSSLEETQYLKVPATEVAVPDVPSFEETQFLQETSEAPSVQPVSYSEETYEEDYEEEYEEAPRRRSRGRTQKALIVSIIIVTILLLISIGVGIMLFLQANADDGLILSNVSVAGINLGGMTPDEAEKAIHRATDLTYSNEDMVVQLPDSTLLLSPADTGVKLDVAAVVEAAYNYGRTGTKEENAKAKENANFTTHTIALLPYLNLNTDYIRQALDEYGESFNTSYVPANYVVEGQMPELAADLFDQNAPCQTLVLNPGVPGKNLDLDKVYNQILDAYSLHIFLVQAEMSAPEEIPEALDLNAIWKSLHIDAVDASMDMDSFEVTPEVYGYTFDLENAKTLLAETPYGENVSINLEYIVPNVVSSDLDGKLFRDVLASYETPHTDDSNRNNNLKLACKAINGLILNPGDTFEYNKTLGKRTEEAGYKEAGALSAGESIREVGGGICQVSSTLYYCTLLADMEIVERRSHSLVSSYIPIGMDATVSWGGPDFRFKNNTDYPIRLEAEVADGKVKVRILGTDERDYYVKMEHKIVEILEPEIEYEEYTQDELPKGYTDGKVLDYGATGYTVYTYRVKYSQDGDKLLSKDYEATSNYVRRNKVIVKVIEEETEPTSEPTEPTTEPTEAPTEAPTTAPTEKPTEAPTTAPTEKPTEAPTTAPTEKPTEAPTTAPTEKPTEAPTTAPTEKPTEAPTTAPTEKPTEAPTTAPTEKPTEAPTTAPTEEPTEAPTTAPTEKPTVAPTTAPTEKPTVAPTTAPTEKPTEAPTSVPTEKPTEAPTEAPTEKPTEKPTEAPTEAPTETPTEPQAQTAPPTQAPTQASTEPPAETTPPTQAPAGTEGEAA